MTDPRLSSIRLRPGRGPAIGAIATAAGASGLLMAASPLSTEIGGRLALAGLCVFALSLAVGSPRAVGLSTLVMLGATLASTTSTDRVWLVSAAVGTAWYIAVELAWHSIDRRTWVWADTVAVRRRIGDVATVAFVAALMSGVGLALAGAAPDRTVWVQALMLVAVLAALTVWTRTVRRAPETETVTSSASAGGPR